MLDPIMMMQVMIQKTNQLNHPLKLTHLTQIQYLLIVEYLRQTGKYPFSKSIQFQRWDYGPVISSVYYTFEHLQPNPITSDTVATFHRDENNLLHTDLISPDRNQLDEKMNQLIDQYMPKLVQTDLYQLAHYLVNADSNYHHEDYNMRQTELKFNNPSDTLATVCSKLQQ